MAPATGRKIYPSKKVQSGCIFLTVNTYRRVPVFREPALCEIFFRELDFYRSKYGFRLYAYVLLPDHFHLLLDFPADRRLGDFLRDFKSALGRLVVDWAEESNRAGLLARFRLVRRPRRRRDASYCVLQPTSYARAVTSRAMFRQKLDYVHANPMRERLVEKAIEYKYSSLRNFQLGTGAISIDPHNLLLD